MKSSLNLCFLFQLSSYADSLKLLSIYPSEGLSIRGGSVAVKPKHFLLYLSIRRRSLRSAVVEFETTFLSGLKLLSILRVADSLKLFAWSVARSGKFNLHSIFSGSSGPVLWRLSFPAFHPAERTPDTLRPFFYPNKGPGDLSVGLSIRTLRLSFFSLFQPESLEA